MFCCGVLNRYDGIQLAQSFLRITSSIMIFCQFSNWGCQLQLQFSQPFLHQFWKSLCPSTRGDPDDSKTPPEVIFPMGISQENEVAQKLLF